MKKAVLGHWETDFVITQTIFWGKLSAEVKIPCIKRTAHLLGGDQVEVF